MDCLLRRNRRSEYGIFGELFDHNFIHVCFSLEHAYPDPKSSGNWIPKIPAGVYKCVRYKSPHFGYDLFLLQNVPGHDHCEIHVGNKNENSNGCILLGTETYEKEISKSMIAFHNFIQLQKDVDEFQLTVED